MSNVHHLRNVAQGAGRWNAWRKQEPGVQPDLAQADLRGADLAGLDLGKSILSLANLKKADLSGANLKDANLAGANLEEVNLAGANLEGANIAGAYLLRANFSGCNLRRVNLAGAGLVGKVNMAGADLTGANLAGARLVGAKLSGANMSRVNLAGADLRDADLSGANLTDADTSGTRFDGADLCGTVLQSFRSRPQTGAGKAEILGDNDQPHDQPDQDQPDELTAEHVVEAAEASPANYNVPQPEPEPAQETEPPVESLDDESVAEAEVMDEDEDEDKDEEIDPEAIEALVSEALQEQESAFGDDDSEGETDLPDFESLADTVDELEAEEADVAEEEVEAVAEETPARMAVPAPAEEDETLFFNYETKNFAILSLYLSGLAEKTPDDRHDLLDLLSRYNKYFLDNGTNVFMAAKANAVIAAFEDPTAALRSADRYLTVLKGLDVDAHIAINWGAATIRRNPADNHDELITNSISPAARLEPLANAGEVAVLEEIRSHPDVNKSLFEFTRVTRKWKRDVDHQGAGVDVVCYLVTTRSSQ
ncbi:MAG: pentapeptide repeat-containing protein [Alphaproteobacteria bacterium]|nr:pentapeptide repeat-containing protein [Alphaproteobacteria bacterium]